METKIQIKIRKNQPVLRNDVYINNKIYALAVSDKHLEEILLELKIK
jgi:hypothetical protein